MSDALKAAAQQLIDPQGRELAKAVRWLELDLAGLDPKLRWPVAVVGHRTHCAIRRRLGPL